ncbi:MAG: alanine racemase [Victivallaceae bacterium]|nr:alanine racemase [Victivallaceae bacterium]
MNLIHQPGNRVVLEVDLDKVRRNFRKICAFVAPSRVTAVLKANAYGLGVMEVARVCKESGADSFGVADLNEAVELRALGLPVMVLGNILPDEIPAGVEAGIILPVNDFEDARRISVEAERQHASVRCQILVDSGMGRLGMLIRDALREIRRIVELPHLEWIGIYSHFPVADELESEYTQEQIRSLQLLVDDLEAAGIFFRDVHAAGSDGIGNYPQACRIPFNRVRPGLSIYGCGGSARSGLEEVVSLKSRLVLVRKLPAGSFIGYGRTHCLKQDTLVGTVAAGYADGLPLALSNRGHLLVRGRQCPVLGRVSMDYTTVDLGAVPEAGCGDEVVCIGRQGGEIISIRDWAVIKNTHAHDILCAISPRVKRVYKDDNG